MWFEYTLPCFLSHDANCSLQYIRLATGLMLMLLQRWWRIILLDMVSVCLQFPRRVRRDSRADWHWICLLQLPQQRGHVPCVHKAALHRGRHPAGTVMQYRTNTPFMIHCKQSDRFPLGIVVPHLHVPPCCCAKQPQRIFAENLSEVDMSHFKFMLSCLHPSQWLKAGMQSCVAHTTVSSFTLSHIYARTLIK